MSRYFVTDPPVPIPEWTEADGIISDVPPNIIWIKARMDVATSGKVTSELFTMGKDNGLEARVGENQAALLVHNIVRWEGPDLSGVPCTPDRIRTLDPNEPHIAKVLEEIALRNKKRGSPNPKSQPTTSGSTNGIAPGSAAREAPDRNVSLELATGVSRSPLLRSLDGARSRSDHSTPTS